jgi:hypothetical protein
LRSDGGADWRALDPSGCIPAGSIKRGYSFDLDPEFCCYLVQFTGPQGEVLAEVEECFDCVQVGTQRQSWSNVKQLYR